MKAIEISGWWYVVKNVWVRKVATPSSQQPSFRASSFKTVKRLSYFEMFSGGKALFTTDKHRAHRFHSLESVKQTFGEIKTYEDSQ